MLKIILTPLRVLIFSLLVFGCLRAILFFCYYEYFESLDFYGVVYSFLFGVRFDLSITLLGLSIFILPILSPFNFKFRSFFVRLFLWLCFFVLILLWIFNLGDILYFGEVYRHVGQELLLLSNDMGLLLDFGLGSRLPVFLTAVLSVFILAWLWQRFVIVPSLDPLDGHWAKRITGSLVAFLILVFAARGGLVSGRPLGVVDVYAAGNAQQAALALNGAFAVVHGTRHALSDERLPLQFYTQDEMKVKHSVYGATDPFVRLWDASSTGMTKKNIVVVLLESWSTKYIDGLSGEKYGVTPNFDALISNSRVWENAYAAGQRSVEGIQAVLTSVPVLVSQPVVGWGLEQNRMTRLASLLAEQGYMSVMMQSSNRRSFHMDGIAASMGFDYYFGKEDLPVRLEYPGDIPTFGWDYEVLMSMADFLDERQNEQPFLAFLFTGTTHEPFPDPGHQFHLYDHKKDAESAYLNTLHYSDWALGEFMRRASEQSWYENTIFVFVADHALRASASELDASFRIPLMIYTPDQSLPAGRETVYASQYDVLPTLIDFLGVKQPIASFGRSLLQVDDRAYNGVMVQRGDMTGWISPEGSFGFNRSAELDSSGVYDDDGYRRHVADWLKWRLQLSDQRLLKNEWLPYHLEKPASLVMSQE